MTGSSASAPRAPKARDRASAPKARDPGRAPAPRARAATGSPGRRRRRRFRAQWRRVLFVGILVVVALVGGLFHLINDITTPAATSLEESSVVCLADVADGDCDIESSAAQYTAGENGVFVPYDAIPPVVIQAVLATEDRQFFEHSGVDPLGIARAAFRAVTGSSQSRQGGSTITQQLVKLRTKDKELSLARKLREAGQAIKVEREMTKEEILEEYLNAVYFGRGAYGIEAASREYFDKSVRELRLEEAALLAGLIRAPEKADPSREPAEAKRRRRTALDGMVDMGLISPNDADRADTVPFEGTVVPRTTKKNTRVTKDFGAMGGQYIAEWVRQQLIGDALSATLGIDESSIYQAGLRVYLSVDPVRQRAAYQGVTTNLGQANDPSAALVSIDEGGRVLALVGGQNYRDSQVNFALGKDGGGSGRQPGSTFKPFALAAFVAAGNSISSVFEAPAQKVFPGADDGQDWTVSNYDEEDLGFLTVEQATWASANTVYAQLMGVVGPQAVVDMAKKLGITSPVKAVNSTVLGTSDVSVLELATAYSTLANHGVRQQPYVIRRVENRRGKVLYEAPEPTREQVIPADVADTVTRVLRGVIASPTGTGKSARLRVPAAGKTGTTGEYRDAWFAGFTCHVTTVVWVGYPTPSPMTDVRGVKVTGGTFPAAIWKAYMTAATATEEKCEYRQVDVGTTRINPELQSGPATTTTTVPGTTPTPPGTEGQPVAPGGAVTVPTTVPTAPPG